MTAAASALFVGFLLLVLAAVKPLAGATTATRSCGRSAGGGWKVLLKEAPVVSNFSTLMRRGL